MSTKYLCALSLIISAILLAITAATAMKYVAGEPVEGRVISVSSSRSGRYLDIDCGDRMIEVKVDRLYNAQIGSTIHLRISRSSAQQYILPYQLGCGSCFTFLSLALSAILAKKLANEKILLKST